MAYNQNAMNIMFKPEISTGEYEDNNFTDESYTDSVCSHASNEIVINWNSPAAYLAGAIEALLDKYF